MRTRLFSLWGLFGFALAQPLFDLCRRNPVFLIEHEAGWPERLLLVAASWLLPGLLIAALLEGLRRVAPRVADGLFALCCGALVAATLLSLWNDALTAAQAWASGIACGAVVAVCIGRSATLRTAMSWSVVAAIAFSAVFLWPEASSTPRATQFQLGADEPARSLFVVVLDELPLSNLLDERGRLDADRFPQLAQFARDAVWFRNATTANAYTERSLPILLTGKSPRRDETPLLEDHPENLFTWLAPSHHLVVSESLTRLCPPQFALRDRIPSGMRLRLLLSDAAVLWLHRVLPPSQRNGLPAVGTRWIDFFGLREGSTEPAQRVDAWLDALDDAPSPLFGFAHWMLPHNPYVRWPDGTRYARRIEEPFLDGTRWIDDPWAVRQAWFRARLQTQDADRLLGKVFAQLRGRGLYDDALIAVVADHGASFRPGLPFRNPIEANRMDMLAIPMFVKLPGNARGGTIDERLVSSLDFLPTVLDAVFGRVPTGLDGLSRLEPATPGRDAIEVQQPRAQPPVLRLDASELAERDSTLARMHAQLSPSREGSFGPYAPWVGVALDSLPKAEPLDGVVRVRDASVLAMGELRGNLEGLPPTLHPLDLVLASSQRVLAVTRSIRERAEDPDLQWLALLPREHGLSSIEELQFFAVREGDRLAPIELRGGAPSQLDRRLGLGTTARFAVSGFYDQAPDGGELCRWSDGRGLLVVPIRPDQPASALRIALKASAPDGCELELRVGGRTLLRERIPAGPFERTVPLPRELQSPRTEIELRSSSFVPAERIEGSRDERRLGVLLRGIWLLSGPVDTP